MNESRYTLPFSLIYEHFPYRFRIPPVINVLFGSLKRVYFALRLSTTALSPSLSSCMRLAIMRETKKYASSKCGQGCQKSGVFGLNRFEQKRNKPVVFFAILDIWDFEPLNSSVNQRNTVCEYEHPYVLLANLIVHQSPN